MASIREIVSLPLSKTVIDELVKHGFRVVRDLEGLKPLDLCQEIKSFDPATALHVLNCAQKSSIVEIDHEIQSTQSGAFRTPLESQEVGPPTSAKDLLMKMGVHRPLITFCKEIDTMLGGGVMIGQLTEFCGVPGVSCMAFVVRIIAEALRTDRKDSTCYSTSIRCSNT